MTERVSYQRAAKKHECEYCHKVIKKKSLYAVVTNPNKRFGYRKFHVGCHLESYYDENTEGEEQR